MFLSYVFVLKIGMCLQGLKKFHQDKIFKILRKLSIQKPLIITKKKNSNSIGPKLLGFYKKYLF